MAGRPMPFRNPAGHAGLRQNLISFVASLTQFFQTRLQLAARESKAAVGHLVIMVACGIAAAVLLLFGHIPTGVTPARSPRSGRAGHFASSTPRSATRGRGFCPSR